MDLKRLTMRYGLPAAGGFALFLLLTLFWFTRGPGDGGIKADFEVKSGQGSIAVTHALRRAGLIKSTTFFRLMLMVTGNQSKLKKGVYNLDDGMSAGEIIDVLVVGRTKTIRVTIPEGYNNRQVGDVLTEKGLFASRKEFLTYASKAEFLEKYNIPAPTIEGYLFPDTYVFSLGYPKELVIKALLDNFLKQTAKLEDFPSDPEKRHKLINLASIVEREAQLKEERALIAGVFANRLKRNYPLESCATIQYLFDKPKKRLYFADLERPSPYNTYRNRGLPPGPISNPGLAAISGALKPEKTDYMFFVVRGDGSHVFSKTFNAHVRAKNKHFARN